MANYNYDKRARRRSVPGHPWWMARRVNRDGTTVRVQIRHRLMPWRTFAIETSSLRFGAEAAARELQAKRRSRSEQVVRAR